MFLDSVNPDVVLAFFVIVCSVFQSHFKACANAFDAVGAVVISIVIGYLTGWFLISHLKYSVVVAVAISSLVSYLGTGLQLAFQEFGKRIIAKPTLLLKWLLPAVFEKLFADEPSSNSLPPPAA